jgi:hypothetical protein
MATLTDLQAQLDKLRTARASNVLTVEENGRRITYRSMADIELAITRVLQDIARLQAANGQRPPARTMRSMVTKGIRW